MKFYSPLLLCLAFCYSALGQTTYNFWSSINENSIPATTKAERANLPDSFEALHLDYKGLKTVLATAPKELTKQTPLYINLPLPDGTMEKFSVVESSIMMPGLAAKFPNIKSYKAWSVDRPDIRLRMDYSIRGFHAAIHTRQGAYYIDPYSPEDNEHYLVYYTKDYHPDTDVRPAVSCGYDPTTMPEELWEEMDITKPANGTIKSSSDEVFLRTYRMAVACTGDFGAMHGGTKEQAMAAINTAVNRINEIFEREVAVRMLLIDGNDELVWTDPEQDPYQVSDNGGALLGENESLFNNLLAPADYDLGHVFTARCTDVGGVVSGTACGPGKARGVTCHSSTDVNFIAMEIMAHEIAHQFATSHSWNNCPGSDGQRASGAAYEPGSGSTIMSYSGACGPENNVQFRSDDYYNIGSIEQYIRFTRETELGSCHRKVEIGNTNPVIEINYEDGFFIPINTPFELNATATDAEDQESLDYCWEQYDLGPPTNLGEPILNAPLFRTNPPIASGRRVFPNMQDIVNNRRDVSEVLPTYNRDMTFRITVRDNNPMGTGTVWETVAFEANENAGPFKVLSPSMDSISWEVGSYQEIRWDVANTTNRKVNCQEVNIKLSTDGGYTYPITLVENAKNDGSEFVVIPDNITSKARIRVEAAKNIFFDISNNNFEIVEPTVPGYSLNISPSFQQACQPALTQVTLETGSILGYEDLVNLEIVEGLPEGAAVVIRPEQVMPGESFTVTIDFAGATTLDSIVDLTLLATAPSTDSVYRHFSVDVVNNDFSTVSLTGPENGLVGLATPTFEWTPSQYANTYDLEVATSPLFGESNIITETGLTETTYTPSFILEENTVFYWRIRATNECGPGEYLAPYAFRTQAISCAALTPNDLPITLSGSGTQIKESTILVTTNSVINDLNIPRVVGQYQPVNSLRLSLVSPAGTEAILFDQNCGNTVSLLAGFDDQAPDDLICPPGTGQLMRPREPLSIFNGEETQGVWTLKIEVVEAGFGGGGGLDEWELEFCGNLSPKAPFLVNNETFFLPPGTRSQISPEQLLVEDEDNESHELVYTIVSAPTNGTLYLYDEPISVDGKFRQIDVNLFALSYEHDGDDATMDGFTFTVEDGTSGWLGTPRFNIEISEDATVSTLDPEVANAVQVYPNPATDLVNIVLGKAAETFQSVSVINVHGQVVLQEQLGQSIANLELNTTSLTSGVYFLSFATENGTLVKKITIL